MKMTRVFCNFSDIIMSYLIRDETNLREKIDLENVSMQLNDSSLGNSFDQLAQGDSLANPIQGVEISSQFDCALCNVKFSSNVSFIDHCSEKEHKENFSILFNNKRELLRMDKDDIVILPKLENIFDVEDIFDVSQGSVSSNLKVKFTIQNNNLKDKLILNKPEIINIDSDFFKFANNEKLVIKPGSSIDINMSATNSMSQSVNIYTPIVMFQFIEPKSSVILKFAKISVIDSLIKSLKATVPYSRPKITKNNIKNIVAGVRPNISKKNALTLSKYPLPKDIEVIALKQDGNELLKKYSFLSKSFFDQYVNRMPLLLHLEESSMNSSIKCYNISATELTRTSNMFRLKVPGLAEKRPSVIIGDKIYINFTKNNRCHYEGFVHDVELDSVLLKFNNKFGKLWSCGELVDVEFTINRTNLRLQHRAVRLAYEQCLPVIFSENDKGKKNQSAINPKKIDGLNREQTIAVRNILNKTSNIKPFIIFGPPGTGKTETLIEAVYQILKNQSTARILCCAPSNSATDVIAKRLIAKMYKNKTEEAKIFRIYSFSRKYSSVSPEIRPHCNYQSGNYFLPVANYLREYRVIVTTLLCSGKIAFEHLKPGFFSHIFIDEAGQATEPELLVPIAGNYDAGHTQLIMAGDPKQLGPVLNSSLAIKFGLDVSLMERLMANCIPYKGDKFDEFDACYIVKLLKNYRSHKSILEVPSQLFYSSELQNCADSLETDCFLDWDGLKIKTSKNSKISNFAILFHGVIGEESREANSPSFFNAHEISCIKKYVDDLKRQYLGKLKYSDIGIISPYHKQVLKLRKVFNNSVYNGLNIGSVEEFQGRENKIIIITTVRSNIKYLALDTKHNLGFISNPKRFNVAITRAKALLIIVGNPNILSLDPNWKRLLEYCKENNFYVGAKLSNGFNL